jgi:hypothetical protein
LDAKVAQSFPAAEALGGLPLAGLQDCVPLFASREHPAAKLAAEQGWSFARVELSAARRGVTEVIGSGDPDDPYRIVADEFSVRRDLIAGGLGVNANRRVFLVPDHVPAASVQAIPTL